MIPYFIYMISVLYYFTYYITNMEGPPDDGFFGGSVGDNFLRCLILILTIVFLGIEVAQMLILKGAYLTDKWNWVSLCSYVVNLTLVFIHVSGTDYDHLALA